MNNFTSIKSKGLGGYLCNGNLRVPKTEENAHYRMVLEDIANGAIVEPEFATAELNAQLIQSIKAETKAQIIAAIPNANLSNYREKELTLLMRSTRLLSNAAGSRTVQQKASLTAMESIADKIDLILSTGDEAEANLTPLADIVWP